MEAEYVMMPVTWVTAWEVWYACCIKIPGFVQTLESPGKRHRSWKIMEIPGKSWNSKAALLNYCYFCFE